MKASAGIVLCVAFFFAPGLSSSCAAQETRTGPDTEKPAASDPGANAKKDLSIRYIANEGVLIRAGEKSVLIDALHREYKPAYAFPPKDLQNLLENARPPYDRIDLLLVSHIHLDHFHPEAIGRHLQNNPRARLATSEQAVSEIARGFEPFEKIRPRITPVRHVWKTSSEFVHKGIRVRFLGLRHANRQHLEIQNFGHIIEIGGKKLLHIGDADMTAENFSAFEIDKEGIDVAFIPYWYLLSEAGRKLIEEQFAPDRIIAVHIPPGEAEATAGQIQRLSPQTIAFTEILQEVNF